MARNLKIILLFVFLGVLTPIVIGVFDKLNEKEAQKKRIASLPKFIFTDMFGQTFDNNDLQPYSYKILVYFNTTCEYCQAEAEQFQRQHEKFKSIQLLFISTESTKTIKKFAQQYNLLNHDNIRFLHDRQDCFSTLFGANSIPYFLIYNSENKLIYKHKGAIKVENLLKPLRF